ncbi:MAG: carboxypeptidase regulatory-like domain-containing protein [Planctomycetes bacterium]|nr:carboxypeptidase regulatory-like domain-containing protein [Planctomycetota bacterium]
MIEAAMRWMALGVALVAVAVLWFASRGGESGGGSSLESAREERAEGAPLGAPEVASTAERQVTATPEPERSSDAAPPATARELVVRVVDAAGEALEGAQVFFQRRPPNGEGGYATRTSDARGEVRYQIRPEWNAPGSEPLESVLHVELPVGARIERIVDLETLPPEPIELRLEDGGQLELEIVDALGERTALPCEIQFDYVAEAGNPKRPAFAVHSFHARTQSERGLWKSPLVTFDRRWRLAIEPLDGSHAQSYVEVAGPTPAQRMVAVRATLGAAKPMLRARMLDPQGTPLADQEWAGAFETRGNSENLPDARSNAAGELRWPLPPTAMRVTSAALWLWSPAQEPRWLARVALPVPLAAGPIELGELRIDEIPLGAQGIVVDPAGAPVRGARVLMQGRPANDATPYPVRERYVTTDAEGRFAVHVSEFLPRFSLTTYAAGFPPAKLENQERASPESLDLRIALRASGSINGNVLLDDARERSHWRVDLLDETTGSDEQGWLGARTFEFFHLTAGRSYTLRFVLLAVTIEDLEKSSSVAGLALREITGLRIPESGGACDDARLRDIDLRGLVLLREILVVDERRQPLARTVCGLALRGTDGILRSTRLPTDGAGRLECLAPRELRELQLGAPGYAIASLEPNLATQSVELVRGLPVVIELAPDAPEIPVGFELWPMLRHEALPELWIAAFGDPYLDFEAPVRDGRAEIFVAGPGTYSVHWMLQRQVGGSLGGAGANVPRRDLIEVLDTPAPQRFAKAPHPNGVAAALRSFEGQ